MASVLAANGPAANADRNSGSAPSRRAMIARKLTTSALKRPVPSAPVASKLKLRATWRSVSGIQPGKRSERVPRDRPRVTIALRRGRYAPLTPALSQREREKIRERGQTTPAPPNGHGLGRNPKRVAAQRPDP